MAADVRAPDRSATRGLALSIAGVLLLPLAVSLLTAVPQGSRTLVYAAGLGACAAVCLIGGSTSRRALAHGSERRGRAMAGAMIGLWIGATAAVLCFLVVVAAVT
ncbi:MAG TPA: hypothetical protein VK646_09995 [Actinomycetota bacterium]|nr:hypothetical protein [Actinomycetota bacterium]